MKLTCLSSALLWLASFIRDYQTLVAGVLAIVAAWITVRPVWRQLDRMSVQTRTMYRDFLDGHLRALLGRRKWLFENLNPYATDVGQRLYEMRESEGALNVQWIFERAQITRGLVSDLERYSVETRDPVEMTEALDGVVSALKELEAALEAIHIPISTDQSGEDWSFTDDEWAAIGRKGEAADAALEGLVAAFEKAKALLEGSMRREVDKLRDGIAATDAALLRERP